MQVRVIQGMANSMSPFKIKYSFTLHFCKPLIFFYLDKRGQERSCIFSLLFAFVKVIGLLHKIAHGPYSSSVTVFTYLGAVEGAEKLMHIISENG